MSKKIFFMIGILTAAQLIGIAVTLLIQANLGSDTISVFLDGLHRQLGYSLGKVSLIYNFIFLCIAWVISREHIGPATLMNALLTGLSIDFWSSIYSKLQVNELAWYERGGYVLVGQFCLVCASVILIKFKGGMSQNDAISYGIQSRTKIKYVYIRTTLDLLLLAVGWLMGGVVGIGSIYVMLTLGFSINLMLNFTERIFSKKAVGH